MPPSGETARRREPGQRPGRSPTSRRAPPRTSIGRSTPPSTAFADLEEDDAAGPQPDPAQDRRLARGERRRARPAREPERRQAGRRRDRRDRRSASTCSGSSPAPRGSWTASRPTSSWPATPRSSGATRSASWPRSRPGTTRCTWPAGSSGPALATGNTVVLKPSARTPLTALALRRDPRRAPAAGRRQRAVGLGRRRSATRSSATRRSGWSRSPATRRPASASRRSRPAPSSGSTSSSAARRRSSSSTTPTSTSRPRRCKSAGYWNAGQDCTAATRVIAGPGGLRQVRRRALPTRSSRSSGATRPKATTSTWAR